MQPLEFRSYLVYMLRYRFISGFVAAILNFYTFDQVVQYSQGYDTR